jgi:hypothetical protein
VTLPKKIHINHAFLLQLRISLIHLYGNVPGFLIPQLSVSLLQRKAQLCSQLLEALHHLCPGFSRLRGLYIYFIFFLIFLNFLKNVVIIFFFFLFFKMSYRDDFVRASCTFSLFG